MKSNHAEAIQRTKSLLARQHHVCPICGSAAWECGPVVSPDVLRPDLSESYSVYEMVPARSPCGYLMLFSVTTVNESIFRPAQEKR